MITGFWVQAWLAGLFLLGRRECFGRNFASEIVNVEIISEYIIEELSEFYKSIYMLQKCLRLWQSIKVSIPAAISATREDLTHSKLNKIKSNQIKNIMKSYQKIFDIIFRFQLSKDSWYHVQCQIHHVMYNLWGGIVYTTYHINPYVFNWGNFNSTLRSGRLSEHADETKHPTSVEQWSVQQPVGSVRLWLMGILTIAYNG